MKTYSLFFILLLFMTLNSCSQNSDLRPGYRWDLFSETKNWELAKAVRDEDTDKVFSILNTGKIDVNLKEPKFGRTLLLLAVGKDKMKSSEALLKAGANVHISDFDGDQPIHEAVQNIKLKRHAYDILKLLVQYGADVNAISAKGVVVHPMVGAVDDLNCAKYLLEHGASAYYKTPDSNYLVWNKVLSFIDDNIEVAHYMIVVKKMPIPDPILYSYPDMKPRGIYELLNLHDFSGFPEKLRLKEKIIEYLNNIQFPQSQVYKGGS